jgi:hypothetical protein
MIDRTPPNPLLPVQLDSGEAYPRRKHGGLVQPLDARADDLFTRFGITRNARPQGSWELWARCIVRLMREVKAEVVTRTGIPWRRRLKAWRRGFRSIYAAAYGFDDSAASLYVPDFPYAYHCYRMNGFWNPIIGNKLVLSYLLTAKGIPHPAVLGYVVRGRIVESSGFQRESVEVILKRWTDDGQSVVFRPHWSGGGQGVFFLHRSGPVWRVNSKAASELEVRALISGLDRYLATAFVQQAAYAREIYPDTTNTLRVLTLVDDDGPFVASVAHRFGTSRSVCTDNFHQGRGICADVSMSTATLGRALALNTRCERSLHTAHPETGSRIEGVRIPRLADALQAVLEAASCFPEAVCVGWDVVMTDDGFRVLEANAPPGIVVSQLHGPLLANSRVAGVFGRYGCVVAPQESAT